MKNIHSSKYAFIAILVVIFYGLVFSFLDDPLRPAEGIILYFIVITNLKLDLYFSKSN